jgi:hypothetical protein
LSENDQATFLGLSSRETAVGKKEPGVYIKIPGSESYKGNFFKDEGEI